MINLSTDKAAVLTEIARVLKPGGRVGVSDIVAEDHLTPSERAERGSYVGCIAGALSKSEYDAGLEAAGFEQVSVEFTHQVADGMHGAIVKARKTSSPRRRACPSSSLPPRPAVADGRSRRRRSRSPSSSLSTGRGSRASTPTGS